MSAIVRHPSGVKSREIIDPPFEAFRALLLPVLECLNWRDVSERFLWDLVIVEPNVAGEGVRQVLSGIEAGGGEHLGDASVEAFHHPVGLRVAGSNEPVLDAVTRAALVEEMASGRFA